LSWEEGKGGEGALRTDSRSLRGGGRRGGGERNLIAELVAERPIAASTALSHPRIRREKKEKRGERG